MRRQLRALIAFAAVAVNGCIFSTTSSPAPHQATCTPGVSTCVPTAVANFAVTVAYPNYSGGANPLVIRLTRIAPNGTPESYQVVLTNVSSFPLTLDWGMVPYGCYTSATAWWAVSSNTQTPQTGDPIATYSPANCMNGYGFGPTTFILQ